MQTGREPSRGSALAAPRTPAAVPARPVRPTLTLKGKVPVPSQRVAPEQPAMDTAAASSPRVEPVEVVPTPKPALVTRPWRRIRPPNPLDPFALGAEPGTEHCGSRYPCPGQALNALLVAPIGVLRPLWAISCAPSRSASAPRSSPAAGPRWRSMSASGRSATTSAATATGTRSPSPDRCATTSTATRSSR